MLQVEVFSDKLVTEENKNGKGLIDLDTPEGEEIFGGAENVAQYKNDKLVRERIASNAEAAAISELKTEGKIPTDYVKGI